MTAEEKLIDIKKHPEHHQHDFKSLQQCCIINGVLDLGLIEAHETYAPVGMNGGRRCDTISGPCSCGTWH
jgi:hypothetical protein